MFKSGVFSRRILETVTITEEMGVHLISYASAIIGRSCPSIFKPEDTDRLLKLCNP